MEAFADVVLLSRIQFALTAMFHFLFVPMSIGIGLVFAIAETRAYRSGDPRDEAASWFWAKVFTATFAVGVATGITMEFSFGTNWADYSRFVGDIFGAPLAAEALFAFFLESTFLGVILFGRNRVSKKFHLVAAWLVLFGSCLSALWILIANSWMQTPAGAELAADGSKAVLVNFVAAAFNPSTAVRYAHTVLALIVMGAFIAIAIAAVYMRRGKHEYFADRTLRTGVVIALVATCALLVSAHATAVEVSEEQPSKLAMMEGHYNADTLPLYLVGIVDEANQTVIAPVALPGFTSFLASSDFSTVYPGLNDLAAENPDLVVDELPVQLVFQNYHLMVAMFGVICLVLLLALIAAFKKNSKLRTKKWWQWLMTIGPIAPCLAIQAGWLTAEFGRQPYVVYPSTSAPEGVELLTSSAISQSVTSVELLITIVLFVAVYLFLFIAWARMIRRFVDEGPVADSAQDDDGLPVIPGLSKFDAAHDGSNGAEGVR
ncbi:MAG: cytochrome ubiquinol oxidase subunit I [Eggerthellaceae bacterium]|nr:cytochrome ubiquinol oxidase subunit I [Eggerthellaceae bacterium]